MNRYIGEKKCSTCKGKGTLPEYMAPPPCDIECAANLSPYEKGYWLCFTHTNPPTLWRDNERERCLKELGQEGSKHPSKGGKRR
jgi:hypothetical protein